jgi:hypothetical protein
MMVAKMAVAATMAAAKMEAVKVETPAAMAAKKAAETIDARTGGRG